MTGTSQGSAYPENLSRVGSDGTCVSSSASPQTAFDEAAGTAPDEIPSLAPGEWDAAVAAALAAVAAAEAGTDDAHIAAAASSDTSAGCDPITVAELLDAQLPGGRVYTLPIPDGAAARVPTWRSRGIWLSVCQAAAECERGRAALRRHRIAAETFLRGCAAHADYAESATGRRVAVSLRTLTERTGLSIDQLKRCRRVLKMLELAVEHARGKKLNRGERAAAEQLHRSVHGTAPSRPQSGAASVWGLSTPCWAQALVPRQSRSKRSRPVRTTLRRRRRLGTPVPACTPSPHRPSEISTNIEPARAAEEDPTHTSVDCAPQSCGGLFPSGLSVRKDHQARTRAGMKQKSTTEPRTLNSQRAAAELVRRIPALTQVVGGEEHDSDRARWHVGVVCDLLDQAGIDTDRWSGTDIVAALTHDGTTRGWTWPRSVDMTAPLRLVAYRLALIDWSKPSPTDLATHGRRLATETSVSAAYRLIAARRTAVSKIVEPSASRPASAEHRRRIRAAFAGRRSTKSQLNA